MKKKSKSIPRFLLGSSQVPGFRQVGFGLIWEEILTKWLGNGPYELIFGPFGTDRGRESDSGGLGGPKMAWFGGFPKIVQNRKEFA